ncbi:P-loop containing nucleoside triphosphate hydrolase protein [Coniochaeta sp. 2T2.1]|nr:P-loop containing nucleoside triphosphate hydrolase protein [Coniochaeta sp. 2T2.1]
MGNYGINHEPEVSDAAWGTPAMKAALTGVEAEASDAEAADGEASKADGATERKPAPNGWVDAKPYEYEEFGTEGAHTWDGDAKVYEWDGETGDVGPEYPELEIELFGAPETRVSHGIDFSKIEKIELYQEGPVRVDPIKKFEDAGLHPVMLRNVQLCGYQVPTPIQKYCIPAIRLGYDVIGIAQTGSGKTAAYLIPILNKLMGKAKKLAAPRPNPAQMGTFDMRVRAEPLVVIVVPTRELAVQIFNEARKFCYRTMLRPCVAYGGGPIGLQIQQLGKGCDILIASPGRLIDFIERPDVLTLRRLRYMVIDEADEMLDQSWSDEFSKILSGGEQEEGNVSYFLFSATFPKGARDLAKEYLSEEHVRFRVGRAGSTHGNIKQQVFYVQPELKRKALLDLLTSMKPTRTVIFVNNKRVADELDDYLFNEGIPCCSMHSDRTQKEREAAMRAFRKGDTPVLIATGVSARGIDVRSVGHVINYDLPSMDHGGIVEYTHRIGRTGRIGNTGIASSFYSDRDEPMASVLTRTLMETQQEIPDFLEAYKPEGDAAVNLKFEADSDFEENDGGSDGGEGGGWGAGSANGDDDAAKSDDGDKEKEGGW